MKGGLTPCPAEPEPYVLSRRLGCTLLYSSRPFYRDETPRRVGLPPPVAGKPSWGLGSAIWLPKLRGACREASIYASRPPVRHWWVGGMSGERQHGAIHVATGGQLGRRDRVGSFGFEGLEWWVDVAKTGWDALSELNSRVHAQYCTRVPCCLVRIQLRQDVVVGFIDERRGYPYATGQKSTCCM